MNGGRQLALMPGAAQAQFFLRMNVAVYQHGGNIGRLQHDEARPAAPAVADLADAVHWCKTYSPRRGSRQGSRLGQIDRPTRARPLSSSDNAPSGWRISRSPPARRLVGGRAARGVDGEPSTLRSRIESGWMETNRSPARAAAHAVPHGTSSRRRASTRPHAGLRHSPLRQARAMASTTSFSCVPYLRWRRDPPAVTCIDGDDRARSGPRMLDLDRRSRTGAAQVDEQP